MSEQASTSHLVKARLGVLACLVARASKTGDMALQGPHQVAVTSVGVWFVSWLCKGGGRGGEATVYDYDGISGDYGGELRR